MFWLLLQWEASTAGETQMHLEAITGTAVIRATVGGRICSLQLSVSKCLLYDLRERKQRTFLLPDRVWMEHRWIIMKVGGRTEQVSFLCCSFLSLVHSSSVFASFTVILSTWVSKFLIFLVCQLIFYVFYICKENSEHSVAYNVTGERESIFSGHCALGRVHPGLVASLSHGHIETNKINNHHSHLRTI